MQVRACELCNSKPSVFCPSDNAFLCRSCDAKVHEANFLVARHLRRTVCSNCSSFTGEVISGVGFLPSSDACASCPPPSSSDDFGSASSSVCNSSTISLAKEYSGVRRSDSSNWSDTLVKRRMRSKWRLNNMKAEGIFVNWCGKLGLESSSAVETACRGLRVCAARWSALPFRVCLAASIWLGLRLVPDKSGVTLKRVEEISGVPAKIISAVESKLERIVTTRQVEHRFQHQLEEGWDEC